MATNLFHQQNANQLQSNNSNGYGQYQNNQFSFHQQPQQQNQSQGQAVNQNQYQSQQPVYIHSDMPLSVNDLQEISSPTKSTKNQNNNRPSSSKKKLKVNMEEKQNNNNDVHNRHSSNQFQAQPQQQSSKLHFSYPQGISSTASPKRVNNMQPPTYQLANTLTLDQQSMPNHMQQQFSSNISTQGPQHLKNASQMYQTAGSKYSQDSYSKQSAQTASNFIQNQAQLPTNKNHLTKKQIHPNSAHQYASNHSSSNNHNSTSNVNTSQQQVQNMMQQVGQVPTTSQQQIVGFYNQITPKNNKRQLQDSLQNTVQQNAGVHIKNGISLQNSKTKPIFNHNSNSGTIQKGHNDNMQLTHISSSTQVTSNRMIQPNSQQKLLLQNIKLKRAQHDNNSVASGLTNIVLDSSGSAVQNFSSNGGTFQEVYSTDGIKQQQLQGPINGLDLKMIMPLTSKNGNCENQFATSIFSKNQLLNVNNKKNYKIINNVIQEQNMKASFDKDDKQISLRQESSKRSQKTQDRIQSMIHQNLESPKQTLNFNNINREGSQKQSLSPKQKQLKQQVLQNQQQWLLNSQQNVSDPIQQNQYRDQKSSSRQKMMKKNFSIAQNNLKVKSPYNQQLQSNQSNLLKFFHQNSKFQNGQNMNSVNAGYKNSFSNYLSSLNHTQDQQFQGLSNLKQQQVNQVAHLVNPQLDFYTQNGHLNQLSIDANIPQDANQYYYQLSNHKRKNQSTDRRHLSNTQKVQGRNAAVSLTKRDTTNSQASRGKQTTSQGGLQGSNKKLNKKRASSQVKSTVAHNNMQSSSLEEEMQYTHQILEQQIRINQLENQVQLQQQQYEEDMAKPETKDQSIDLQTSFEKQRTNKINIKVKSYRNDLNLFVEKLSQNTNQEKEKLLEEFQSFLFNLTEDTYLLDPDCPPMRDLIKECFKVYNDQFKLMQSQMSTQQNISPSAYEILKQDYDKLQKENQFNKEKLKMAQEYSQQQRMNKDKLEKKLEEREQVILLMQETFEKEIENLYTENDIKKFARELNVLYEQNQELHKMNKRMKYELRMAQEREHQFIKLIKKSPELMRMLDMEDSSILDNKVPQYKPKPQEVLLVSSKQVPINKLDLEKVEEIQKLQAQGTLPPLEESKIIDKKEMRDQVKDMIIQDNDSEDEHSLIQHEEMNRKKNNNMMQQQYEDMSQNQYQDDEDDDEEGLVRDFHDEYNSEDDGDGLYNQENQEVNYIYKTQNQMQMVKNGQQQQHKQIYEDSAKNKPPQRKQRGLRDDDDDREDLDDL